MVLDCVGVIMSFAPNVPPRKRVTQRPRRSGRASLRPTGLRDQGVVRVPVVPVPDAAPLVPAGFPAPPAPTEGLLMSGLVVLSSVPVIGRRRVPVSLLSVLVGRLPAAEVPPAAPAWPFPVAAGPVAPLVPAAPFPVARARLTETVLNLMSGYYSERSNMMNDLARYLGFRLSQ